MNALPGIGNENEFYSELYIAEFLARDIARDDVQDAPSLDHLGRAYLTIREQWERTRDPAARLELQRDFHHELLTALGYTFCPQFWLGADDAGLPALAVVKGADGAPACVVFEVLAGEIDADSLACSPQDVQLDEDAEPLAVQEWEQWISSAVFGAPEAPRWVVLLSAAETLLIDRHKWAASRLLRFDWETLFTRREGGGLKVAAGLLACESLVPGSGQALLDRLDERAHKHAYAVSEDLKYALRESVELIGNEVVRDLRERRRERIYERDLAAPLTRECLTFMYRLLFLFFVEARPTLGYAPMASEVYAKGYSLERLRDVAEQRLTSPQAVGGDYLNRSLKQLFELIWNGFPPESGHGQQRIESGQQHCFELPPLKCHLFDPARTPLINRARLSNGVLHRVLELMSLTRPGSGRRGRVSYANLGINQLGAVYEALLAYRGFFAEQDLYEVKPAKERWDPLKQGYFVAREALDQYEEDEKVFDPNTGRVRRYEKGSYIYRLAGREREQSASYYTPESLTQCLVKYALKERLDGLSADEILHLTVCEPAMGSAAFLNEAVNQLAETYLSRKQDETGETIQHERYSAELQRVRMRIADTCVFGADLNPVAVELAEVSLWLNAITDGAFVPWFGTQIVTGNSLIGARREVYAVERLTASRKPGRWHEHAPERLDPDAIGNAAPDRAGRVYHFLLPDPGMSRYADRVVKDLVPERIAAFADWRRGFCKKLDADEVATVQRLSDACDALWQAHAELLARVRAKTTDALAVWPAKPDPAARATTTAWKDKVFEQEMLSAGLRHASPYRRLSLAMDYWCALWFWPIEQADALPDRSQFWMDLALILEGRAFSVDVQDDLFPETRPQQELLDEVERLGHVDVENLIRRRRALQIAEEVAARHRFLHWELEYADVFARRGGFDLVLGNPPWIKVEWQEDGVMADADPLYVIKPHTAPQLARLREAILERLNLLPAYLAAYEGAEGMQNFLNATQNYPLLRGVQTNLYKCFLPVAWRLGNDDAVAAFLHPEGVYDDPKGGALRSSVYLRLRDHFQFINELALFAEVHNLTRFSVNVYGPLRSTPRFAHIANLYTPSTVDECFEHHGHGEVHGIKTDESKWETRGHSDRILHVTEQELTLFAKLYDAEGTPALAARLPALHARQLLSVLEKFAVCPRRLGDLRGRYLVLEMWHETNAQNDNTIRRQTGFPADPRGLILSGPHFFVGNPLYKTPRRKCESNKSYDVIDLTAIPDDYRPRTNYVPVPDSDHEAEARVSAGLSADTQPEDNQKFFVYESRLPRVPWNGTSAIESFRVVYRKMIPPTGERTLAPAILPFGFGHIDGAISFAFENPKHVIGLLIGSCGITSDFMIRATGKANFRADIAEQLPVYESSDSVAALVRIASLCCITRDYEPLWNSIWTTEFVHEQWTTRSGIIDDEFFANLTRHWSQDCALRCDFSRRQALLEIDVLVAHFLGLSLDELLTIYRVQFPVMRQYEADTWYDQRGRIVFTPSKGLPGIGFSRTEWNDICQMRAGTVERTIEDDTQPGGPLTRSITYHAPFFKPDREADYRRAWEEFERRAARGQSAGANLHTRETVS